MKETENYDATKSQLNDAPLMERVQHRAAGDHSKSKTKLWDFTDETTVRIEIKVNINSESWLNQL